jgi:hypothetical protein
MAEQQKLAIEIAAFTPDHQHSVESAKAASFQTPMTVIL